MKTNIKKIVAITMSVMTLGTLAGCGNTQTTTTPEPEPQVETSKWVEYAPDIYDILDLTSSNPVQQNKDLESEDYLGLVEGIDVHAGKDTLFNYYRDLGFTEVEYSEDYGFSVWTPEHDYRVVVYICYDNPYCDDYLMMRVAAAECYEEDEGGEYYDEDVDDANRE